MAAQADLVVVPDRFGQVFTGPCADMIRMRIVAHPAGKLVAVLFRMDTGQEFLLDGFEMVLGEIIIAFVAVKAAKHRLKPELIGMGKAGCIIGGMAVGTAEAPVV